MTASDRSDPVLGGLHDVLQELEDIFKDLHANPELYMQEERTSGKAAERSRLPASRSRRVLGNTAWWGCLRTTRGRP